MTLPLDDDMTELVDAQIDRVDLVKAPANGRPFVLMKAAAEGGLTQPLVPADMVRDLLAKAQEAPDVTQPAPADDVAKDAPPVAADDLIPAAPGGTTAATVPGSPDWEQLDGETAMGAVATLGRVRSALAWLSDREAQEAVTGDDPRDGDNAWNLDDLACQLDWIIGQLAGFAVGEQLEAELAPELEAVGKAVAAVAGPLAVVEGLAPIAKAGRVLSSANETAIRTAVDSLTGVLNSLPQAPVAEEPVTKETAVTETPAAEPVDVLTKALAALPSLSAADTASALLGGGRTQEIAKAAGDPQLAVFDADGKLIGTIDPAKLSPIATSPAAAEKADEPADDEGSEGDVAAADPAATPADPAPAPAAPATEATIPGTATVQSPPEHDPNTVAKAAALAALEEFLPTLAEEVRKNADLAKGMQELQERVEKMGQQPDDRRSPVLNGASGTSGGIVTRGSQDDDKFVDLRKAVDEATTPTEKADAQAALAYAKVAARFER